MADPKSTMCRFRSVADAVEYAKSWGGRIAVGEDGAVLWFDAAVFTLTPVIKYVAHNHGGGSVGVWPLFDPDHPCHAVLKGDAV